MYNTNLSTYIDAIGAIAYLGLAAIVIGGAITAATHLFGGIKLNHKIDITERTVRKDEDKQNEDKQNEDNKLKELEKDNESLNEILDKQEREIDQLRQDNISLLNDIDKMEVQLNEKQGQL